MICTGCRAENLSGRRYCGQCGKALFLSCFFCGFGNSVSDKFCGGCGRGTQEENHVQQAVSQSSSAQKEGPNKPPEQKNISKAMLDELLGAKKEFQKQEKVQGESKKSVSQDDIDKLLNGGH